ncbi:uncharacterized protein LOC141607003 [Silene latifolia]|uniref:uncharacterized protein LOC141607003 n=1 Tax=Silene latifolia TaxID=37657 RepID=UPI003D775446
MDPPDFDPSKILKRKQPKNKLMMIRTMLSMSIRCNTCGNYMSKGTKFNSRKEDVVGEKYLGIQVVRFYIKCTNCSAEITIKTDPRNSDFTVETGASRNFEPLRKQDEGLLFLGPKEFVKRIDYDDDDFSIYNSVYDIVKRSKIFDDVDASTDVLATGNFSVDRKKSDSSKITFNEKKKDKIEEGSVLCLLAEYDSQDAEC